jgi:hypothetical protein
MKNMAAKWSFLFMATHAFPNRVKSVKSAIVKFGKKLLAKK